MNLLNTLDKIFRFNIYPRDQIFSAKSEDLNSFIENSSPIIKYGGKNMLDMVYYPFFSNGFFYFYGSIRQDSGYKHLIFRSKNELKIEDINDNIETTIIAKGFVSPSAINISKKTLVYLVDQNYKNLSVVVDNEIKKCSLEMPNGYHDILDAKIIINNNDISLYATFWDNKQEKIFKLQSQDCYSFINPTPISFSQYISKHQNNPCVVFENDEYIMVFRTSNHNAYLNDIWMAKSKDGINFYNEKIIINHNQKNGSHGVAFPFLIKEKDIYYLLFTKYWGKHLLEPITIKKWKNKT